MEPLVVAVLAVCLGLLVGSGATLAVLLGTRRRAAPPADGSRPDPPGGVDAGLPDLLAVLRSSAMIVDTADRVVLESPAASALGLVRAGQVAHEELRALARQVRGDGVIREAEFRLSRGPLGPGTIWVGARVAPIGAAHVILLLEDRTQARRIEEVRRDFVANVSHELKTPVGGISLLAEAVLDACEDPQAVARFARRIQLESDRLARLVKEIIDLSRLQASETLSDPVLVAVRPIVREAIDGIRTLAESRHVALALAVDGDPLVYGDAAMLVNAVSNLLANAVNYSPDHTRASVSVRTVEGVVEIAVTDQGRGISPADQQRIFERFYRVDSARSRATGGTGLGLAIVKHICANHGGEVTVWSVLGSGSTFTIRLPAVGDPHDVQRHRALRHSAPEPMRPGLPSPDAQRPRHRPKV